MKIKTSETENGKIELRITASPSEVQEAIRSIELQLAVQNGVPLQGLDTSEALTKAVKDKVGEAYYNSFIDFQVMNFLAPFAITQEKLSIIGPPKVTSTGIKVNANKELEFTVEAVAKPEYEITDFSPVKIQLPKVEISEEEIDEQLVMMAESQAMYAKDADGEGADSDGKEDISEGGQDHLGEAPQIDDAWVKENFSPLKTVQQLRDEIRKQGLAAKTREVAGMKSYMAASEFAKRLTDTIPDELYELTRDDIVHSMQQQLNAQGRTLQDYIQQAGGEQQFSMQLMMQTREVLVQGFSLDALARHLKLEVTDDDIAETFSMMAPGYEVQARMDFEATGRMYQIYEGALRNKASKWLIDNAEIEEID